MNRLEKKLKEVNSDLFGRYQSCRNKVELLLQKYTSNFPRYTDHSINHTNAVLLIVSDLLNDEEIAKLNGPELYVLCTGTILHDVGMCIPEDKISEIEIGHRYTNYKSKFPEKDTETLIRDLHHELSYDFIIAEYQNLDIEGEFYAEAIALTAQAHRKVDLLDFEIYNPQFSVKSGREHICLPYLGAILRLADELDVENGRTPDLLTKYYLPENEQSRIEWEKHRSTFLVTMHGDTIKIQAKTDRQNIYHALEIQFNKVENVLEECHKIIKRIAFAGEGEYKLQLSKVKTEIKTNFVAKNVKFSIDVPNVIETLMGKNLYKSDLVSIRELIQNSLDSVLYKKTFGNKYNPFINISISEDNIICEDNGGGMDEYIVEKYFSKLSSSFYKSEKLENDYKAIGRFGIGVFSYFMIADFIHVETKKGTSEALHFLVDKNPENYFYFYSSPERKTEGTKVTLNFNKDFKKIDTLEIVEYIKKTFLYVDIPITIYINGDDGECLNSLSPKFTLESFLQLNILSPFWKLFSSTEKILHSFKNEEAEGIFILLPSFPHASVTTSTISKHEISSDVKPLNLYNQGIFVADINFCILRKCVGVINLKKSNHITLDRTTVKGFQVTLALEEISFLDSYLESLKKEKKLKLIKDSLLDIFRNAELLALITEFDEIKLPIISFVKKYIAYSIYTKKHWYTQTYEKVNKQKDIYFFSKKEMAEKIITDEKKYSILKSRHSIDKEILSNYKYGLELFDDKYVEIFYKEERNDIYPIEKSKIYSRYGSYAVVNLKSDKLFIYSNLYRDKDGELLHSNEFVNTNYPILKFLIDIYEGEHTNSQKTFASKQYLSLLENLQQISGRVIMSGTHDYLKITLKNISEVFNEINNFFSTSFQFKKSDLPDETIEIAKGTQIHKWLDFT